MTPTVDPTLQAFASTSTSSVRATAQEKNLVEDALRIRRLIDTHEADLKDIETRLKALALEYPDRHEDLVDAEREGKQFLAQGFKHTLPIVITADSIIGTFADGTANHRRIEAASLEWQRFYSPVRSFANACKDGKQFRARAVEILGEHAPTFISNCLVRDKDGIPKNSIKIEYAAAKEIPKEAAKS